jgi:hypothetical protein
MVDEIAARRLDDADALLAAVALRLKIGALQVRDRAKGP